MATEKFCGQTNSSTRNRLNRSLKATRQKNTKNFAENQKHQALDRDLLLASCAIRPVLGSYTGPIGIVEAWLVSEAAGVAGASAGGAPAGTASDTLTGSLSSSTSSRYKTSSSRCFTCSIGGTFEKTTTWLHSCTRSPEYIVDRLNEPNSLNNSSTVPVLSALLLQS